MKSKFIEFVYMLGVVAVVSFGILILLAILAIPIGLLDSHGCERTGQIQGVETEWHFSTGCVYVDPDYVVTK